MAPYGLLADKVPEDWVNLCCFCVFFVALQFHSKFSRYLESVWWWLHLKRFLARSLPDAQNRWEVVSHGSLEGVSNRIWVENRAIFIAPLIGAWESSWKTSIHYICVVLCCINCVSCKISRGCALNETNFSSRWVSSQSQSQSSPVPCVLFSQWSPSLSLEIYRASEIEGVGSLSSTNFPSKMGIFFSFHFLVIISCRYFYPLEGSVILLLPFGSGTPAAARFVKRPLPWPVFLCLQFIYRTCAGRGLSC